MIRKPGTQSDEKTVVLTRRQRHELAIIYRQLEILDGDLKRAKAKYPKADPYWVVADIWHSIILYRDAIAKIYEDIV